MIDIGSTICIASSPLEWRIYLAKHFMNIEVNRSWPHQKSRIPRTPKNVIKLASKAQICHVSATVQVENRYRQASFSDPSCLP